MNTTNIIEGLNNSKSHDEFDHLESNQEPLLPLNDNHLGAYIFNWEENKYNDDEIEEEEHEVCEEI